MAATRVTILALLLLYGIIIMGDTHGRSVVAKACPLYCLDVDYMTCASSGEEKLTGQCNCCLAPKNCTLHLKDGTTVSCT
ncbi:proteinase inhibitor type-2 TR8 [Macadamia integrifolia]|uniref:proteinase inhibitor type-2 TR8 n=1 Tax=Macadamia integrifolia TaxID=60698 RepID=UPI001C4EC74E|nr:proteinase inhibitor type-2 TR8 [Macadamia integrifolia]